MIEACIIGVAICTVYVIASKYKKFTLSFFLTTLMAIGFFAIVALLIRSFAGFFHGIPY